MTIISSNINAKSKSSGGIPKFIFRHAICVSNMGILQKGIYCFVQRTGTVNDTICMLSALNEAADEEAPANANA